MPIRLKHDPKEGFYFQIDCCYCGRPIRNSVDGAVFFKDELEDGKSTTEFWFVHKRFASEGLNCFANMERKQGGKRFPWWELPWFLKCISIWMDDLKVSGSLDEGSYTVKKIPRKELPHEPDA